MIFEILDDICRADLAIRFYGESIDDLFHNAAVVFLCQMMENPSDIRDCAEIEIRLDNTELDLLLYKLIEELIFIKDSRHMLLLPKSASVMNRNGIYSLVICLTGEKIDRSRHTLKTDVKAITMHSLSVSSSPDGKWIATIVLDV